jgi:hypothetical protein
MNFFNRIGSWFKSIFAESGTIVQEILHDVSSFTNLAVPLVTELAGIAAAAVPGSSPLVATIATWLGKFVTDATAVESWVTAQAGKTVSATLQSAATTALATLVPAGALRSDLNLAVEFAVAIFKRTSPAKTTPAPAAPAAPAA